MGWPAFGVGVGAAAAARSRLIGTRVRAKRHQDLTAQRHAAELAGQNAEATGVDSAVDRLERAMALLHLGSPAPDDEVGTVAAWKERLAATSRASAAYLGDVLFAWQRARNAHPDLSGAVWVHVREGQGTTLLTAAQALDLRRQLDARPLAGKVLVELAERTEPRPGRRLDLSVNGDILSVASDLDRRTVVPDPLPTALFTSTVFQLLPLLRQYGGVPWRRAFPPAAASLALALANERELWTGAALDAKRILLRSFPLAVWSSVVATVSRRDRPPPPGSVDLGFPGSFAAHQVLVGFCLHRLSSRQQVAA